MSASIELSSKAQEQARNLQRLHDEEQSFLRKNGSHSIDSRGAHDDGNEEDEQGYEYPQNENDCAVLCSAWSRLSCPTRFLFLLTFSALCFYGVYTLGVDEGVREENHAVGSAARFGGGSESSDSDQSKQPRDPNAHYLSLQGALTPELMKSTRKASENLIRLLQNYHGGEEKAKDMLMRSWQAGWELDVALFLDRKDVNDDDDDDNNGDGNNRKLGKKKKNKNVKVLNDPQHMSEDQKKRHHQSKRERVTKLISTMATALLNPNQSNFMIGTIGSSVAAGHDNCHYDCYEAQLERTLQGVFEAAGMKLTVQNAGEGGGCGDSHENQVFCITHNVSPNVDIIHYSWTYFEKGGAEVQREQLIRWGQKMQRRPMVHHLVARGKANTCDADSKENVMLDDVYARFGYNAFCIQTALYAGGHDYDAEEAMGIKRFGWKFVGDGYHNTTRYGELLPDDDPRKESLGTVYRNWHPGPLGFEIAADAFAYVYASGVLMALDIIEADMSNGLNVLDRWFDTQHRKASDEKDQSQRSLVQRNLFQLPPHEDLNEPLFCDPLYCSIPNPPSCLNYEKPTFGTAGIKVKDQAGWKIWHENNKWNYMVGKLDTAIFKAKNDPEWFKKCSHLDACGGMFATDPSHGELIFELPSSKMESGVVIVCGCCGKKVGESMFLQNAKVEIKLNGRILDKSTMIVFPNPKCVRLLSGFEKDGFHKEDTMLLSFELSGKQSTVKTIKDVEEASEVKISHLIAL
eukprot:CCRYP_011369-RB/>CCRYP_011369-RB protein AED:0.32 eAED:0.32 QI:174/1/1/1/0.83/0.71/7/1198/743